MIGVTFSSFYSLCPSKVMTWTLLWCIDVCVKPDPAVRPISIFLPPSPFVIIRDHSRNTWSAGRGNKGGRLFMTIIYVHWLVGWGDVDVRIPYWGQLVPVWVRWSPAAVCGGGVCSVTRASSGQASDQQVAAISPQHLNTLNSVSLVSIILPVS